MHAFFAFKPLVVLAIVFFTSTLSAASVQPLNNDELIAPRSSPTLERRSLDLGRSTRLHRSRRRRRSPTTPLPKPYGTTGAATTDVENLKLLEKYVEHQTEINTAWQKQANKDISEGKTAIMYDAFAAKYDGVPFHHGSHTKSDDGDTYDNNTDSKEDNYSNSSTSKSNNGNQGKHSKSESEDEEQCDTDNHDLTGERGPTIMDRAREEAKKKAKESTAKNNSTGAILGSYSDKEDNYGSSSGQKSEKGSAQDHKEQDKFDQKEHKSATSASKNDAEMQKEKEDEKQRQDKQQQEEKQRKDKETEKQKEEQKKAEQKKQQEQQQQAEEQQKEQAKKEKEAQKQKEEAQKQKQKEEDQKQKQKQEEEHKQSSSKSATGPLAQYLGQTFSGDMTYYDVGLDACGWTDKVEGHTVAVSPEWFDAFSEGDDNPNHNKICGKKIKIYKNGKTEYATITDQCPPCTKGSIDMSQSLFETLENVDVGRCNVKWEFVNE